MNNLGVQIWTAIVVWLVLATVQISPLLGICGSFYAEAKSLDAPNNDVLADTTGYLFSKQKLLELIDSLPMSALFDAQLDTSDTNLAKRQQGWQVTYGKRNWDNLRSQYVLKTGGDSDLKKRPQGWETSYGKRQQGWHSNYGK